MGDHPWSMHDQDALEACNEGRETRGFWQDDYGQGEAREDHCEGLLRGCPEEERLSLSLFLGTLSLCWLAVPSGRPTGAAPLVGEASAQESSGWGVHGGRGDFQ